MTTNYIDTTIHGSSFPSTYVGSGTIAASCRTSGNQFPAISGFFTGNGNVTVIPLGFRPMRIKLVNDTDGITYEWQYGMAASHSIKTVLGGSLASTLDTSSIFTISTDLAGNHSLSIAAAAIVNSKTICFDISG